MISNQDGMRKTLRVHEQTIDDRGDDPNSTGLRFVFKETTDGRTSMSVYGFGLPNGGARFIFDANHMCASRQELEEDGE